MSLDYSHYWQYFLAIEDSLRETARFVDFSEDNLATYSIEFARILLTAGSEIDVICKMLCKQIDATKNPKNINEYRRIITGKYPKFYSLKVWVRYGDFCLIPWETWNKSKNPDWWKCYNNVKHERNNNFQDANLRNTLNSVAGLYCLVLYHFQTELNKHKLEPRTKLVTIEDIPQILIEGEYKLPDF